MERHPEFTILGRYQRLLERRWENPTPPYRLKHKKRGKNKRSFRIRSKTSNAPVLVSPTDRLKHLWCLGRSGMGKTTFLHNTFLQDVYAGRGCALIDPHGDLAEELLSYIPPHRRRDVIYFNPLDLEHPIGLNVLGEVAPELRPRVADGILSTFHDIWKDSWGPALHELLEHALLATLDIPGGNLVTMNVGKVSYTAAGVRARTALMSPWKKAGASATNISNSKRNWPRSEYITRKMDKQNN